MSALPKLTYSHSKLVFCWYCQTDSDLPHFSDCMTHFHPPHLGGKWGCVLYSECSLSGSQGWGSGAGSQEAGAGPRFFASKFFFPYFLPLKPRCVLWSATTCSLKNTVFGKGTELEKLAQFWKKQKKTGWLRLPNSNPHCKARVIRIVWFGHRNREIDHWNRKVQKQTHMYGKLIFHKGELAV